MTQKRNVLDGPLDPCGLDPVTGYTRNGCCDDGPDDPNPHTICAIVTREFIDFQELHRQQPVGCRTGQTLSRPCPRQPLVRADGEVA